MGVLQEFERRLEGAVEGFFSRAFRSGIQPLELARAVQRYMADHQHVTADGVVVPNVHRFRVGTKDHGRLSAFGTSLTRELGEVVARTAAERGWVLRGPVKVRVDSDDSIRVGRFQLQGRVEAVDREEALAVRAAESVRIDQTQVISHAPVAGVRAVVRSGGTAGTHADLAGNRVVVGRLTSCALELDDATVSREHAAFVHRGDTWWVIDLGSTNGTRVNGSATTEQIVGPGDVVEFGGVAVELVEA